MNMQELGELICHRTPYPPMTVPTDANGHEIEWDDRTVVWDFRGEAKRVGRSIRIPVVITFEGHEYKDWLLIGYEGSSGD